ncbi:dihydroxyacetone kinase phosphoryl donor subunit DhaM [Halorubrum lacusprofundi]|jgi:dihydroxyacetone kinase phosphotransfer subunit|uniref:phosphoenolpyruvate--glycerone phosphotransferase n=1 Tax=Halorubrum lacusprofundi (strain ATCC 49239 / DSM 5036 / JCM 8891 / ACAM 34) TaxID=416348 RepID=B9LNW0_HALLT|nr:dihydroxyacetone kinase phosphoryl donor subunit DhaM [Halorubrum lacusprofundi]ACM57048.1 dihydroxyacetone kinase, phosphotransfer subunit [Halorubrum lacusprofundi ATCC 49239]MCG1007402.1 PTS-dependent dihydroxyacetone kinase phosphotransferase subunit DhaM [Halorubrum lacusprofundi]
MVGLVVVSHSERAAEGIVEVAAEMAGTTRIEPVGGDGRGGIGTVPDAIEDAIDAADDGEGVVVLVDLGSAVMNADVAVEMSDAEAVIADAPVLEGAVNAAVAATDPSATLDSVREQAEAARGMKKL